MITLQQERLIMTSHEARWKRKRKKLSEGLARRKGEKAAGRNATTYRKNLGKRLTDEEIKRRVAALAAENKP